MHRETTKLGGIGRCTVHDQSCDSIREFIEILRVHTRICGCIMFGEQVRPSKATFAAADVRCATPYLPSLKRRRCITLSFMGVALIARGRGCRVPPLLIRSLGAPPAVAGPVQGEGSQNVGTRSWIVRKDDCQAIKAEFIA